jgi:hypothetical protein
MQTQEAMSVCLHFSSPNVTNGFRFNLVLEVYTKNHRTDLILFCISAIHTTLHEALINLYHFFQNQFIMQHIYIVQIHTILGNISTGTFNDI